METPDVALELPTGTGKTTVGLLIAEWHRRRTGNRVAYLTLTNQLARQVLVEAGRVAVPFSDLIGTKRDRDAAQEGHYLAGEAVGVTSYSNLFNVNPVIRESQVLVLDDAHGGEQYVAAHWTLIISKRDDTELYSSAIAALRPALTDSQLRTILSPQGISVVEIADVFNHPACIVTMTDLIDQADSQKIKFRWQQIREHIDACLFLLSSDAIAIRPLIPPTHTHDPFSGSSQRVLMSATLGGKGDLLRGYGLQDVEILRAERPQWGRRYVFVPGMYLDADKTHEVVSGVWDKTEPRRAVVLAPSNRIADATYEKIKEHVSSELTRMSATEISDGLDSFTVAQDTILVLSGRYDGLDLPGDDCRLLIMSESPAAVNELERHLRDKWKLGPALRRRERTRLIQGMGRCTRSATDFSVILWLGQSLVNAASSELMDSLPAELHGELKWGHEQSKATPDELVEMIHGLLDDKDYREEADASIDQLRSQLEAQQQEESDLTASDEVKFARSLWSENYSLAYTLARSIADVLSEPGFAGWRAWWWFLANMVAVKLGNNESERDCLRRAKACGINSGWLDAVILKRASELLNDSAEDDVPSNLEHLWDTLEELGWAGPKFESQVAEMRSNLADTDHTAFHMGLEKLGRCLGLDPIRSTEDGAPDVIWSRDPRIYVAFEAKTEKDSEHALSKNDLREAKGHADWISAKLCGGAQDVDTSIVVVSPTSKLHFAAEPHAESVFYLSPETVLDLMAQVIDSLREIRIKFAGRDFAAARNELAVEVNNAELDAEHIWEQLTSHPLK